MNSDALISNTFVNLISKKFDQNFKWKLEEIQQKQKVSFMSLILKKGYQKNSISFHVLLGYTIKFVSNA